MLQLNTMPWLVVLGLDDKNLESWGKFKCMLSQFSCQIPIGGYIMNHLLWLNLNLPAASLEIFLNRWAVDDFVGKSMKLINIIQ